ncbi:pancreatic progenitor cell differentiation and proliferation factor-like protein [Cuculus canorus]|uniref:pancreatic progenitor cell differentiation and proliferation factor-like protein n=1 Tax=Cuculus canorus TaxID=55661 RepID=UPI0023AA7107|nr:pancreatic progenitor cell differentiation and proliferation factor-like protein [Cuculus canorus]
MGGTGCEESAVAVSLPTAGDPERRRLLPEKSRLSRRAAAMASVPSAGCLLAKNQYYRTRQNSESSVSSSSSCCLDTVSITDQDKAFNGLPEIVDKCWWIKSFFHSEPSPPTVGRKTLSASSTNS